MYVGMAAGMYWESILVGGDGHDGHSQRAIMTYVYSFLRAALEVWTHGCTCINYVYAAVLISISMYMLTLEWTHDSDVVVYLAWMTLARPHRLVTLLLL